jgi:hypothetical protein
VFIPDVQQLNVTEGRVATIGRVNVWDEDDDVLSYSILLGNDAGYFRMDNASGMLYTALPVDYEAQPSWSLLVQARELTFDRLISTGTVMVTVLDANDPPVVTSQHVELDESRASLGPQGLGQVVAFDPDNNPNYPEWSQLSFNVTANAFNRSQPLLSVDASTGVVSLLVPLAYTFDDSECQRPRHCVHGRCRPPACPRAPLHAPQASSTSTAARRAPCTPPTYPCATAARRRSAGPPASRWPSLPTTRRPCAL